MADRVLCGSTREWVCHSANTIVVITRMVRDMKCFDCVPGLDFLCTIRSVELVHHEIEIVLFCQSIHFYLATPLAVTSHHFDVIIDTPIVLNPELVVLLVLFDIIDTILPKFVVAVLCSVKLVTKCPE